MEFKRWKFSKQVKPELEEFLKCVKNNEKTGNTVKDLEKEKIWQILLPQQPQTFYELEDKSKQLNEDIIIDLDADENISYNETETNMPDISVINLTLAEPNEDVINPNLQDFVDYFTECFTNETLLQIDDIKKITTELNPESVEELFRILVESVSDKGLINLGESLCIHLTNQVARQYCKIILLDKLKKPISSQIFKTLVIKFVKVYPEITREEILLPLLYVDYKCGNIYQIILNNLQESDKEKLLRDFVFSCSELETFQLQILQPLIPSTNEHSVKRRIINLMSVSVEKFKTDKLFIKILIELIRNLGKGYIDQEPVLYQIIDINKTLLKSTAMDALNEWFNIYNQE